MPRFSRLRLGLCLAAGLFAVAATGLGPSAFAQQLGEGMDRTGTVGIQNDDERKLFFSLLCTCGCPRETLGTCTCGFAHQRRDELRGAMKAGKSTEQIIDDYVGRFGTQALAVPPNEGAQRVLYMAPLIAIVAGAGLVIMTLRRWQKKGAEAERAAKKPEKTGGKPAPPDDYDEKLDDELNRLD